MSDSFVLLDSDAEITAEGAQLKLRWADSVVTITWSGDGEPVWEPQARGGIWVVRYDREALGGIDKLVHRWELSLKVTT